jgi:hypothetical protein
MIFWWGCLNWDLLDGWDFWDVFFASDSAVRRGPFVEIVIEVESEAPYGAGF